MALTTYKWSIEEWHDLVDSGVLAGKRVELLEGEIIVRWSAPTASLANPLCGLSPEGIPHRNTNHKVVKYLRKLLDGIAEVYESHPITLDNSEPEPDIAVVRLPESIYNTHHPYPQDIYWLVEISNKTLVKPNNAVLGVSPMSDCFKKDLERKTITYARNGIPEYWVIDLNNNKLLVHTQPQNNKYAQVIEYKTGTIASLAFPQITIALDRLLLY